MGASETEAQSTDLAGEFSQSTEALFAEIERLTKANRANRERETERRLLRLRHLAGIRLLGGDGRAPSFSPLSARSH